MSDLQNIIMSDNSRLFAYLDNYHYAGKEASKIKDALGLKLTSSRRKANWYNFNFRNHGFSMLHHTGDIILFADNRQCPERILKALLAEING